MAGLEAFEQANPPEASVRSWCGLHRRRANVNGRDFLVSGSTIGMYSLPEVVAKVDNPDGHMWTLDELDNILPESVTGNLRNMWPKKEEKPAGA